MGSNKTLLRLGSAVAILGIAITVYLLRPAADVASSREDTGETVEIAGNNSLPRLLDLGADKCVPCKMMAPILDELKVEYTEVFRVEFIDVWKNPDAAKPFKIKVIPTQIFFDPDGNELFRHEGFYGREDILAKWRELGVETPENGA